MLPPPDGCWTVADHELEERVVGDRDRTDPRHWEIGYGWPVANIYQRLGLTRRPEGWPVH